MSFWQFLQNNWTELAILIKEHLILVFISILIAVIIGVPTGILLTRHRALRGPVLGIANVMQTIPSLALFGFLIPLPFIGGIGTRTALVALVVYSLLPIIRNTVTGILGVEPSVREAAVAMGMTDSQVLRQVELPLAAGVIITGIRVATVIAVGVTTIAAAVGAGGLGVYIFRGLRQYDNNLLLAGAVSAALLALAADFLLGLVETRFSYDSARQRWLAIRNIAIPAITVLVTIFVVVGLWRYSRTPAAPDRIVVGSKDFTESALLAEMLAQISKGAALPSNVVTNSAETCRTKRWLAARWTSTRNTPARRTPPSFITLRSRTQSRFTTRCTVSTRRNSTSKSVRRSVSKTRSRSSFAATMRGS
jgi:osmoprotectant transport system permease protein